MGESGPYYVHTFPADSARAERIQQILSTQDDFDVDDFKAAQLDLLDLRALRVLPDLLDILSQSEDEKVVLAHDILRQWDGHAASDAIGPCLYYPFSDRLWPRKFMRSVFDDPAIHAIPTATPALNLFDISHFLAPGNPWRAHRDELTATICNTMADVVTSVAQTLGDDHNQWRWGDLHQIHFSHRLARHEIWKGMEAGPDPIGGSGTTLGMALHMGPGPGRAKPDEVPCRVYHGPAFRLIVDLADPDHIHFVIAGGNGGRAGSPFATNQYPAWLKGDYLTVSFIRSELDEYTTWHFSN